MSDYDNREQKIALLDHALGGQRQTMAQVNFKSGNRVNGMLSKQERPGYDDLWSIAQAAQTKDEHGRTADAIAVHTFDPLEIEAVVVLKMVEKSSLIS